MPATLPPAPLSWNTPLPALALGPDDVHVWRISLEAPRPVETAGRPLSAEEWERARRFYFPRDRVRFLATHTILRLILARYLEMPPEALVFDQNAYGKPHLAPNAHEAGLGFNLSHSHQAALLAVAREREVGIDLEWIRADFATLEIAERFFSPRETEVLKSLPPEVQSESFFNCWTRKEAFIKAKGLGLSLPLDRFDVSLRPGEPARLIQTLYSPPDADHWSMAALDTWPGYAAAICVEGSGWELHGWQWEEE